MIRNKDIFKLYTYNALINLSLVSNILSIYLEKIGFSLLNIGMFFSIMSIGKVIFEVPTGYISDRYGNKISLILALVMQAIAFGLLYLVTNFYGIILAFILLSIAHTLTTGCYDTILVSIVKKSKTQNNNPLAYINSINRVIYYCSAGVAALFSGYLFENNLELLFILNIICVIICAYIIYSIDYDKKNEKMKLSKATDIIISHIFNNKVILYLFLIEASINFSMIPVDRFVANYLYNIFNIPISTVTFIMGLVMILVSFLAVYLNKNLKILSRSFLVRYIPIIMILVFLIFSFANNAYIAIFSYAFALILFSIYSPHNYEIFQENIIDSFRTTIISIKSIMTMGVAVISQPIFGYFSDRYSIQDSTRYLILFSLFLMLIINIIFRNIDLLSKEI